MKTNELQNGYAIFGNKGNVWNNNAHITDTTKTNGITLCGVPMLSTNWARIEEMEEINCVKCVQIYEVECIEKRLSELCQIPENQITTEHLQEYNLLVNT